MMPLVGAITGKMAAAHSAVVQHGDARINKINSVLQGYVHVLSTTTEASSS